VFTLSIFSPFKRSRTPPVLFLPLHVCAYRIACVDCGPDFDTPPCLTAQNVSVFVSVFIRFCPGMNQKDQADCYMLPGQFWSSFGQVLVN